MHPQTRSSSGGCPWQGNGGLDKTWNCNHIYVWRRNYTVFHKACPRQTDPAARLQSAAYQERRIQVRLPSLPSTSIYIIMIPSLLPKRLKFLPPNLSIFGKGIILVSLYQILLQTSHEWGDFKRSSRGIQRRQWCIAIVGGQDRGPDCTHSPISCLWTQITNIFIDFVYINMTYIFSPGNLWKRCSDLQSLAIIDTSDRIFV